LQRPIDALQRRGSALDCTFTAETTSEIPMADRQLKLPFSAKPVTRIVPARLGAAAQPSLFMSGSKGTVGSVEARHPALVAGVSSGAPGHSESK
jgi:hypothetical protein